VEVKKLGMARLVAIEGANGLLNKPVRDVLEEFGMDISPYNESDYWYREIIYCVRGELNNENKCPDCGEDISDRGWGWRYCPYCGSDLDEVQSIHEEYKTYADARRSEYFKELGITEFIRFGVKKLPENIDQALSIA